MRRCWTKHDRLTNGFRDGQRKENDRDDDIRLIGSAKRLTETQMRRTEGARVATRVLWASK
ncbi:hypothetical protein IC582_025403 [Cucumis melo]